jgi:hypothetical protein
MEATMTDLEKMAELLHRADVAERGWWKEINDHNGTKNELRRAQEELEKLRSKTVTPAPPSSTSILRACNRHNDCDAADLRAKLVGVYSASHCHDDTCEDCFGC